METQRKAGEEKLLQTHLLLSALGGVAAVDVRRGVDVEGDGGLGIGGVTDFVQPGVLGLREALAGGEDFGVDLEQNPLFDTNAPKCTTLDRTTRR